MQFQNERPMEFLLEPPEHRSTFTAEDRGLECQQSQCFCVIGFSFTAIFRESLRSKLYMSTPTLNSRKRVLGISSDFLMHSVKRRPLRSQHQKTRPKDKE